MVDALSHMYVLLSTLDARFPIVLVPRYKLSLCHTPIKPDLLGFLRIGVFACGLLYRVFKRFALV